MVMQRCLLAAAAFVLAAAQPEFFPEHDPETFMPGPPMRGGFEDAPDRPMLFGANIQSFGEDYEEDFENYPIYDDHYDAIDSGNIFPEPQLDMGSAEATPVLQVNDDGFLIATAVVPGGEMITMTFDQATATDEMWIEAAVSSADFDLEPMETAEY